MSGLSGRQAFITGSTQGVGLEIAIALHQAGAAVVLHGLRSEEASLQEARRKNLLPSAVSVVVGDLADATLDQKRLDRFGVFLAAVTLALGDG